VPAFAHALHPISTIAYPWFVLIGTTITLLVGILSSLTHDAPPEILAVPARADLT
jgi:hypothetical protein